MPLAKDFASIRIRPGDHCTIMLGGQLAISGYVETRQVAYTGEQHGVELSGHSKTKALADGAVMHETMEWKNKPFQRIVTDILRPFGIQLKPLTALPNKPFERVNVAPGQSAWNTIEELARDRKIVLGTDTQGNLTARVGGATGGGDAVIEGRNILEGREVMSINQGGGPNTSMSQQTGTDYRPQHENAHTPNASADNKVKMPGPGVYAPNTNIADRPGDKTDMKNRSDNESTKRGQEQLQVTIVVQGWHKPSGGLWQPGQSVQVRSPMLILDEPLILKSANFTQDNKSGTRTTLELTRDTGGEADGDKGTGVDYGPEVKDPAAAAKTDVTGGSGPGVGPG
jgi:prophage tail gpP-like protein